MPITKEQVLKGKRYTEEVHVEGYDEPFLVRPLTDGEYAEVKAVALRNTRLKPDESIDWESTQIADVTKSQAEARFLTVSYGLSVDETWAPEDVKALKPGTAEILEAKILKISGIATTQADLEKITEEVENFRGARKGEK